MVTFAPQALRVIRTRDTAAISLATYVIVVASTALWGVYGAMIHSAPVVVANIVNGGFGLVILIMKLRDLRVGRRG
jgi:MtN3 and saliva related transmembrane protein